ncbi:MAG: LamG-like jellyroll fold domain-containing protein, partial [Victivallales bacterium]
MKIKKGLIDMHKSTIGILLFSSIAIFSTATATKCLSAPEEKLPEPLVSWSCAFPPATQSGDDISSETQTFTVGGSDASLRQMRIMPYGGKYGPPIPVRWIEDPTVGHAISNGYAALYAGVLQIGTGGGKLNNATAMTLFIRFKMNSGMAFGGSPSGEMDGQLMRLPPGAIFGIRGHGVSGKAPRIPFLELRCKDASGGKPSWRIYQYDGKDQIRIGEWTTLAVTWDSNTADGTVSKARMWVNGKEVKLKCEKNPLPSGALCPVEGPILVGGNGASGNVALTLASFAIYDKALTAPQIESLSVIRRNAEVLGAVGTAAQPPAFEFNPELDKAAAWRAEGPGMTVEDVEGQALLVKVSKEEFGKASRMLLRSPLPLRGAKWVNLWHFIETKSRGYNYEVEAIFENPAGTESYQSIGKGYDGHIGPPNPRASSIWKYLSVKTPQPTEGVVFKGLRINVRGNEKSTAPGEIYLRGLGLERIDYKKTSLYYVVGGFRDNFGCVGFNQCGARAMSDFDGGSIPFVHLDNLLDYAKLKRPKKVN